MLHAFGRFLRNSRVRTFLKLPLVLALLILALGTCGDDGSDGGCADEGNDCGCACESDSSDYSSGGPSCESSSPPPDYSSSGSSCEDDRVYQPDYYYYESTGCDGPHYVCVDCHGDPGPPPGAPPPPAPPPPPPAPVQIELVSRTVGGQTATGPSHSAAVSEDGRLVAYASEASNIVPGDFNGASDVFLHDRITRSVTRLSRTPAGQAADGASLDPALSPEGKFAAFVSYASNLAAPDANGSGADLFLLDIAGASLTLVTPECDNGAESPALSRDGRVLAFSSRSTALVSDDRNGAVRDVFIYNRLLGRTTLMSRSVDLDGADGPSGEPALSAEGYFLAFESLATDLIPGDSNGASDIFLVALGSNPVVTLVSRASSGGSADGPSHAPALSADGRFVAFHSEATDLVPSDPNGAVADIFIWDRRSLTTQLLTPGADGASGFPALSHTSRFIAFESAATNLLLLDSNGPTRDVFITDTVTAAVVLATVSRDSNGADGASVLPHFAGDGRTLVFESFASDLITNDSNGELDVFAGPNPLY